MKQSKRILIDGRFIGVGESMTRYCLEIVKRILRMDEDSEYTLLIRPKGLESLAQALKIPNAKFQMSNKMSNDQVINLELEIGNLKLAIADIPHYSLAEQTKLLKYLNVGKYDLVHFIQFNHPVRYRGKFIVTIHDLTLVGHLHRQPIYKNIAFGMAMKSAVRNSAHILTVSETTKQELIEYYNPDPDKITVTHLAVDDKYNSKIKNQKSKLSDFYQKYNISGPYFLYTGMWKKHKNLIRLLKAYEIFIQNSKLKTQNFGYKLADGHSIRQSNAVKAQQDNNNLIQLVLVGKVDKGEPEVINLINRINEMSKSECRNPNKITNSKKLTTNSYKLKAIIATGFIEEKELPLAYAGAMAYIIPSLSEGFGLPPLEAMACGTPVLSSNLSAMPEILGEAPLFFDPYSEEDMAEKMRMVASSEQLRADLSARGLVQVKKYDWDMTARGTLEVYNKVIKES